MARANHPPSEHQKERLRAEIDCQIAEFLSRGGKIDVLTSTTSPGTTIGSVWHYQDEALNPVNGGNPQP